jgi:hypothetical protein
VWATLLALGFASPAFGQVRGIYAPGSTLLSGGTLPDPGFSYANDVWANWPTQFKGLQGRPLPLTGVALVAADTSTFTFVPRTTIMGAHMESRVSRQRRRRRRQRDIAVQRIFCQRQHPVGVRRP